MNIKRRRLIQYFLEALKQRMKTSETSELNPVFLSFYSRTELMEMVLHFHEDLDKHALAEKTEEDLLSLIGDEMNLLSYCIKQWHEELVATPSFTKEVVQKFFEEYRLETHYLMHKPVEEWDGYDRNNYYHLMFKHGKTRKVYALFSSDVKEEEKYAVTTKASYFFDTKEEAEKERAKIVSLGKFTADELKIMSLWKIN